MMVLERALRRMRYGRPIVVVSGLPRSGTSMAMKMLQAGGLEVMTDGLRQADESNPKGYFELESVKLTFYRMNLLDRLFVPFLRYFVNRTPGAQNFYELRLSRLFPAAEVRYRMRACKPA